MRPRTSMKQRQFMVLASLVAGTLSAAAGCRHVPPPGGPGAIAPVDPNEAPPPLVGHNLLYNASFDAGTRALPWTASYSAPGDGVLSLDKGELCLEVKNKGVNRWDTHLRHQHLILQKGHKYSVQ